MTWLIVGLGNPGPDYAATRHNVGFLAVAELAGRMGGRLSKHKRANALVLEGRLGFPGNSVNAVLAQPLSFMNESGGPVKALMQFYDVAEDNLIVLHDELDIAFGSIRAKFGGGDNGHNGLKSMTSAFNTPDYYRVRLGIGRPMGQQDPADFVLKQFSKEEKKDLDEFIERGADVVEFLIEKGLELTQGKFNS
jgi:PTH1 family peptidyl-tRNA hydrolase